MVSYMASMLLLTFAFPALFLLSTAGEMVLPPFVWGSVELGAVSAMILLVHAHGLSRAISGPEFAFLRINYHMFSYVFFCLVPALQFYSHASLPYTSIRFTLDEHFRAMVLLLAAATSFELSASLTRRPWLTRSKSGMFPLLTPRTVTFSSLVLVGLTVFSFSILVRDLSILLSDRWSISQTMLERLGTARYLVTVALVRTPAFVALYYLFYVWVTDATARRSSGFLLTFWAVAVVFFVANFPPAVERITLGSMFFAMAVVYLKVRSQHANLWLTGLAGVGLLVFFPLLNSLRSVFSVDVGLALSTSFRDAYLSAQFDAYLMLLAILRYVDDVGHSFGWQLLSALLFFVPRAVFPAKGLSIGTVAGGELGFRFLNVSSPLAAELYVDFSVFGIIGGFAAMGYVASQLEAKVHTGVRPHTLFMIAFLSGWQAILLRGSMFTALTYLLPVTLLIWVTSRFGRVQP